MPKTIINEIDNTTAGTTEYSNFSVVVPGVVSEDCDETVFDENGIYECSSQSDFKKYVGRVAASQGRYAAYNTEVTITEKVFNAYKTNTSLPQIYTYTQLDGKPSGYKGIIHNANGYFKLSDSPIGSGDVFVEDAAYMLVTDLGSENSLESCGNQMAYELLGLGYTVLYKKFSDISELATDTFWTCLLDKSNYDFRYITTGGYVNETVYKKISAIAKQVTETIDEEQADNGRGDCVALLDIDEVGSTSKTIINNALAQAKKVQDKYSAWFLNKVTYDGDAEDVEVYQNLTFPASFHYLACAAYARNELNYKEWFAVAGYTRGVCDRTVAYTSFKLGEIAANSLQPRKAEANSTVVAVNFVKCERGAYYLYGNRTAHKLSEKGLIASDFLNIRQLCSTLKKEIYLDCAQHRFDPNSDLLWASFCNYLRPTLEGMKGDQGIEDYRIIKVVNDKKALLTAKVRIVPIEAVEDFVIDVYLEDSISGIAVATEEEE